jgi:hypothetical protein
MISVRAQRYFLKGLRFHMVHTGRRYIFFVKHANMLGDLLSGLRGKLHLSYANVAVERTTAKVLME